MTLTLKLPDHWTKARAVKAAEGLANAYWGQDVSDLVNALAVAARDCREIDPAIGGAG